MEQKQRRFKNRSVEKVFEQYPSNVKHKMLELRDLIYSTAEETDSVNEIEETLKWNEPAYLTKNPKTGTTIRIDWKEQSPDHYALYVNCKTNLIESIRMMYPNLFTYEGTRAIHLQINKKLAVKEVKECIRMALTYHLEK